jgi:hypothetical protein
MKLGMYITAPEPISMADFINPSQQSVCVYMYPFIVAMQLLGKNKPQLLLGRPVTVAPHELSSPARTLGSWLRIPLKAWMYVFILFV